MFTNTSFAATKLDKAIVISIAAMLTMNIFVLTQQHAAQAIAAVPAPSATAQA